jgi:conjugal transfer pilus assembly protein TraV
LRLLKIFITLLLLLLPGCSVFNPYQSEFQCPETDKGKCVGMKQAYKESFDHRGEDESIEKRNESNDVKEKLPEIPPEHLYQKSLYEELAGLIRNPQTPFVAPPKVMRVLLLPYENGGELFMLRYIYFFAEEPRWVLGNYLNEMKTSK